MYGFKEAAYWWNVTLTKVFLENGYKGLTLSKRNIHMLLRKKEPHTWHTTEQLAAEEPPLAAEEPPLRSFKLSCSYIPVGQAARSSKLSPDSPQASAQSLSSFLTGDQGIKGKFIQLQHLVRIMRL